MSSMLSRAIWGFLLLLPCLGRTDTLDDSIRKQIAAGRWPGLTLAVVKNGKIVRLGAYGYGNLEWRTPTTVDTKFEVASVSKMVTGAAFRTLVESGKVSLEEPLTKYFNDLPESWRGIRIRHLVTMSTGFPEDFGSDLIPYNQDVLGPQDDASLLKLFEKLPFAAPLGSRFVYSSANYAMMGMIIAKASGQSFASYVRKHVFDPAGMADSSIIDNWAVIPHRAQGYRMDDGVIKRGWYLGQHLHSRPDDCVLTSARDMAKFVVALENHRIVKNPEKLWEGSTSDTGVPLDYSYGWRKTLWLGHRRVEHSGGYRTGFHTFVARYPDDGLSVIVFTNCDYSAVSETVMLVSRRYLPNLMNPITESARTDPAPMKTRRVISALQAVRAGSVDTTLMHPDAFEPVGIKVLTDFLKPVTSWSYAGTHRFRKPIAMHDHLLVELECLKISGGGEIHYLTVYFDASGKIAYAELTA